jgi:hypothetical protein
MKSSKISRFPRPVRDELNRRLDRSEKTSITLHWLNSLPEVHAVLKTDFENEPVKRQNLDDWRKAGFQNWRLCQDALDFTQDALPEELDQGQLAKMSAKLIRCLQIRYAAVAGSLPPVSEDPDTELRRLGDLCNNLTALRRGDLSAERLSIEQQRLAMEKIRTDEEKDQEFWEWTQRPDIQQKLYPLRDKEKIRREVERLLNRRLLGIRDPGELPDEHADPAMLI